ncbi:flagellar filament capping protein FliD [Clostridium ganghwense]|uniref:Filament cap protein n=1 Tax=Clostridium ganghwense TaxID=312089 RepID=A0ABT4CRU3_9CLOT|nr:flagellar filament capping protein FliD [Clostridium ganghwense]MCY6371781.1 flagellar filament capping protein FliD [Clostridium ganghwense]
MSLLQKSIDRDLCSYFSDFKERAEELLLILKSITSTQEEGVFMSKLVSSSDDSKVEAHITNRAEVGIYNIKVLKLASSQKNLSDGLYIKEFCLLDEGKHIFTLLYGQKSIDISVDIKDEDKNDTVLEKLLQAIEKANVEIYGNIECYGKYKEKLVLNGKNKGRSNSFKLFDKDGRIISYTGIWNVAREAKNAEFIINDISYENEENIAILQDEDIILKFNEVSKRNIEIKIWNDVRKVEENIESFKKKYNLFFKRLKKIKSYKEIEDEIKILEEKDIKKLNEIGLKADNIYYIKLNKNILRKNLKDNYEKVKEVFMIRNDFLLELTKFCSQLVENKFTIIKDNFTVEKNNEEINSKAVYTNEGKIAFTKEEIGKKMDYIC